MYWKYLYFIKFLNKMLYDKHTTLNIYTVPNSIIPLPSKIAFNLHVLITCQLLEYCIKTTLKVVFTTVMDLSRHHALLMCAVVKFTACEVLLLNMQTEKYIMNVHLTFFNIHH